MEEAKQQFQEALTIYNQLTDYEDYDLLIDLQLALAVIEYISDNTETALQLAKNALESDERLTDSEFLKKNSGDIK